MFKKLLKITLPILHIVRKILVIFKKNIVPPPAPLTSMIALYEKEETIKCYEYFKPYFKSSVLIETAEIREYAIKKSLENDKNKNLYNLEFGVYVGTSINFLRN